MKKPITGISDEALAALGDYDFPGNVRELRNIIERAVILAADPLVSARDIILPSRLQRASGSAAFFSVELGADGTPPEVREIERAYVLRVLQHKNGQRRAAADALGISYPTFLKRLRELGIEPREVDGRGLEVRAMLAPTMVHILLSWLVLSAAFWLTAEVLPGFKVTSFQGALRVAALFGVINWLIGWLLFVMIGVATLFIGFLLAFLTRWVVNAILLKVTDALSDKLSIDGIGTALLGALSISFFGTLGEWLIHRF